MQVMSVMESQGLVVELGVVVAEQQLVEEVVWGLSWVEPVHHNPPLHTAAGQVLMVS